MSWSCQTKETEHAEQNTGSRARRKQDEDEAVGATARGSRVDCELDFGFEDSSASSGKGERMKVWQQNE